MMKQTIIALLLSAAAIYFFVSAPPPLPDEAEGRETGAPGIPVKTLLDAANLVNAAARKIYTDRIVTPGQEAGLAFSEDWQADQVEAGPLPALFLREVAAKLREQESPLALFLGSDQPINPSNSFRGEQVRYFAALKEDRKPRYFEMADPSRQVAIYADIAVAPGCVSCHNDHPKTPRSDWKLGDVMGAATWTYPRSVLSDQQLRQGIAQVYEAVERAYLVYLAKTRTFSKPPIVGPDWPQRGKRQLPDAETFMSAVKDATGASLVNTALLLR